MDILISAGHKFSQEMALGPQTQLVKTTFCRSVAVPAMFQQNVDLMMWRLSRPRAWTLRRGGWEQPHACTMGLLHARLGLGACPAHSFECISFRNVTWWLFHTSLSQPSSELLPQLLDEDRRAQPAYDVQRPCAEILLAATSRGCSGCWGQEGGRLYRFINLPIYLMLWGRWYIPIPDLYFYNLLMCLCAWCSWDYDSFLFIQAFLLPGDLSTSQVNWEHGWKDAKRESRPLWAGEPGFTPCFCSGQSNPHKSIVP